MGYTLSPFLPFPKLVYVFSGSGLWPILERWSWRKLFEADTESLTNETLAELGTEDRRSKNANFRSK